MNENFIAVSRVWFDPDTRRAIRKNPRQYAIDTGMITADSPVQIKLVVSGAEKMSIPIPNVNNADTLSNEQLRNISAGGSPLSTISTICLTISTARA